MAGETRQRGQRDAEGLSQKNHIDPRQSSKVELFGKAKKTINEIFKNINKYIVDVDNFVEEMCESHCIEGIDFGDTIKFIIHNVTGIMEILERDHMKVAFVGRTSNGKSTVINAMLREKILPSGIGHTTSCFLQVEGGTDSQEAFLLTEDQPDDPQSIQSVLHLADALSPEKVHHNSLIRIVWPKDKCRLLKENVVFIDSPGIDVTPELDNCIKKFCLDSDVFVFVSNAESTLTQTEKNFFHKVKEHLSKPNLFILMNRWDRSVSEKNAEKVKQQHLERTVQFLVDELRVTDINKGYDRVFFVSASEALFSRTNQDKETSTPTDTLQEGFEDRLHDFETFEGMFEECITKAAIKTKFEQHTQQGKEITGDLRALMDKIITLCQKQSTNNKRAKQEKENNFDDAKRQLYLRNEEIKTNITAMVGNVKLTVSAALMTKINALSEWIANFNHKFGSDPAALRSYKQDMHKYVDSELLQNVRGTWTTELKSTFEAKQAELTGNIVALLPEAERQLVINCAPRRDFKIAHRHDFPSLCADFQEDVEFQFSFSFTSLMRKFLGRSWTRRFIRGYSDTVPRPMSMTAQTPVSEKYQYSMTPDSGMTIRYLNDFIPLIFVDIIVVKVAGWKVAAVCVVAGMVFYKFEQSKWTDKAKERTFNEQYVEYAGMKQGRFVDWASGQCSQRVEQDLISKLDHFHGKVVQSFELMEDEIKQLNKKIETLPKFINKAEDFRNEADGLEKELNRFTEQYLKEATLC